MVDHGWLIVVDDGEERLIQDFVIVLGSGENIDWLQ